MFELGDRIVLIQATNGSLMINLMLEVYANKIQNYLKTLGTDILGNHFLCQVECVNLSLHNASSSKCEE